MHLLIDVGEPCVHLLRDRGMLLQEIDCICITHGHVDHIGGLPALFQGCKLLGRTKPLSIYLPDEMIAPLRAWISALYLIEEQLGFAVSWNAWRNGIAESLASDISVTPHRNGHLDECYGSREGADPHRPCDSYSLEIVTGEGRVLFSGDLASAEELKSLITQPTKMLVSELSHCSPNQLAEALQGGDVEILCLNHLSEEATSNRSEIQIQMEEQLPTIRDVIIPEDGEVLDF
jgi:ribonuclease BN (tRNA processing enzyme)